jgi:hypothetical protein
MFLPVVHVPLRTVISQEERPLPTQSGHSVRRLKRVISASCSQEFPKQLFGA